MTCAVDVHSRPYDVIDFSDTDGYGCYGWFAATCLTPEKWHTGRIGSQELNSCSSLLSVLEDGVSEASACFKEPACRVDVCLQSCLRKLPALPTAYAHDRSNGLQAATAATLPPSTGGGNGLSLPQQRRSAQSTESQRYRCREEHCRVHQPPCNATKHDATCKLLTVNFHRTSRRPGEPAYSTWAVAASRLQLGPSDSLLASPRTLMNRMLR